MLLAVTSNPTIDRTLYVPHLTVGQVHRTADVHLAAGGKGLNVTRATLRLGAQVLATAPLGGHAGRLMADLAVEEGLPVDWYWHHSGETRTCLLLNHDDKDATVINENGTPLTEADWQGFAAHVTRLADRAKAVAFAGSLPPGVDPEALGILARSLAGKRPVYLDTSSAALSAALVQPAGLGIKVNRQELMAGLGLLPEQDKIASLIEAGRWLLDQGAQLVVITLGGDGALAVERDGNWLAAAPPVEIVSTVGSGDAFLAGLAVPQIQGRSLPEALAFAVACGAANAMTLLPGRFEGAVVDSLLSHVTLERLD